MLKKFVRTVEDLALENDRARLMAEIGVGSQVELKISEAAWEAVDDPTILVRALREYNDFRVSDQERDVGRFFVPFDQPRPSLSLSFSTYDDTYINPSSQERDVGSFRAEGQYFVFHIAYVDPKDRQTPVDPYEGQVYRVIRVVTVGELGMY